MKNEEIQLIKDTFDYDGITGLLYRKKSFHKRYIGWTAGAVNGRGYMLVRIGSKKYSVHRLAWIISTGSNPIEIDHINHDKKDNRLVNLREVNRTTQMKNRKKNSNNTTGSNGVGIGNGGYIAYTSVNGERFHIGTFDTKEEAVAARQSADKAFDYHKNHGQKLEP